MVDYLIIGSGLAGVCFAEIAFQNNKSFLVVDDFKRSSSRVAGGLYNPVILKRFSQVWKATEQLEYGKLFYATIENKLGVKFDFRLPIYRKFASIEEQNNWFEASDKPNLAPFLAPKVISKKFSGVSSNYGFGEVLQTGYLDTVVFLDSYNRHLKEDGFLLQTTFNNDELTLTDNGVLYKGVSYRNVIFSEGFGMISNTFFNELPLDGTKGELLVIKAPSLDLDVVLKSSVFILPIGEALFKVGSTYNWDDKSDVPTQEGREELLSNLKEIIDCDFEVVEHYAGVRPTVNDRRPLVGTHPQHKNLHLLNGLGTRGVMLGPWLAKALFEHIESGTELDPQIDIKRFYKKRGAK
ncbi:FAD-binding oxidoreductase [Flavobacterium sp. SM15]|uniref:NAD(P)/FAD-dependent oxidoreductase n=1 Tax=Flavobacterium sp. SM15 TaxID=2908005 RepID=UPI001EDB97CB|nr:FAD-dependent oxidoreductase [Flavobacterium sp. SM15]MCG2610664.1 FAD-binding oxidoreductase [Flavobacterium sp. SM15]